MPNPARSPAQGFEMDHICYRVESVAEYSTLVNALVPLFGTRLVESMINGRPISTVQLHVPILHMGYRVACLEIPCPKQGVPYCSGLEHAEFVIGVMGDDLDGSGLLRQFMVRHAHVAGAAGLMWQIDGISKSLNPDVSLCPVLEFAPRQVDVASPHSLCVKFHTRPLHEVVRWELQHGAVEPVPSDYFPSTADSAACGCSVSELKGRL